MSQGKLEQAKLALELAEAAAAEAASDEIAAEQHFVKSQEGAAKTGSYADAHEAAALLIQAHQRGRKARKELAKRKQLKKLKKTKQAKEAHFDQAKKHFGVDRLTSELEESKAQKQMMQGQNEKLASQLEAIQLKATIEAAETVKATLEAAETVKATLEAAETVGPPPCCHRVAAAVLAAH